MRISYLLMMLIPLVGLCKSADAQGSTIYRMFDWELTKTLMTVSVSEDQIDVSGFHVMGQAYQISKPLKRTSAAGVFYFDGSVMHLITSESKAPYRLVYIDPAAKKLELYADTAFEDLAGVEKFIADRQNLITSFSNVLTSDLDLKKAQTFPSIKTISNADQEKFRAVDKKRFQDLVSIDLERLSTTQKMVMLVKETGLVYRNCLLIGYRPPKDAAEFAFLKPFTYQGP